MNEKALRKNVAALVEHALQERELENQTPSKLNVRLNYEYADMLVRLSIIEGSSKSDVIRNALDEYALRYSSALYPLT